MKISLYKNKKIYCLFFKKISKNVIKNEYIPGILGYYINNNISKKAWDLWITEQTKIINKYKIKTNILNNRILIINNMIKFLFKK